MEINLGLFGFRIGRDQKEKEKLQERIPSPVTPVPEDAQITLSPADGLFGSSVFDIGANVKSEVQLINKYRELSLQPEAERAIDEIVNETVVINDEEQAVKLNLEELQAPDQLKDKITAEFDHILKLLDFQTKGYDIFRNWYVDGRLNYHKMIDIKQPSQGIKELRYIDPRKIRKIRQEIDDKTRPIPEFASTFVSFNKKYKEYFLYNEKGMDSIEKGLPLAPDAITHVHSGILNENNTMILSHLHKAVKPHNQLRWMEDAVVIYRISRAPERRVFYIDVGNLPKTKAEQHLQDMMNRHKQKLIYDAVTGEIKDQKRVMTMTEDYFLARREGTKGTEITTLQGGQNLGEMEDVEFFLRKFYKALNVPVSRLEQDSTFNFGKGSEITRDELKFQKFIYRLRTRFAMLFDDLLCTQLILKGITDKPGWNVIKRDLKYDFVQDNFFTELKQLEMNRERFAVLQDADSYVGRYYSVDWVRRNILHQTDEEIKEQDAQMKVEKETSDERDDKFGGIEPKADPGNFQFDPETGERTGLGPNFQPPEDDPAQQKKDEPKAKDPTQIKKPPKKDDKSK